MFGNKNSGGKRPGAGRKRNKNPTRQISIRFPLSLIVRQEMKTGKPFDVWMKQRITEDCMATAIGVPQMRNQKTFELAIENRKRFIKAVCNLCESLVICKSTQIRFHDDGDCFCRVVYKTIPKFKTEDEEREFWATHDSTEYIDWNKAEKAEFPNLKKSEAQNETLPRLQTETS